jgi:hypothetical protein
MCGEKRIATEEKNANADKNACIDALHQLWHQRNGDQLRQA